MELQIFVLWISKTLFSGFDGLQMKIRKLKRKKSLTLNFRRENWRKNENFERFWTSDQKVQNSQNVEGEKVGKTL